MDGEERTVRNVRETEETLEMEVQMAPSGEIKEGESGEWVQRCLPHSAVPTYTGSKCEAYLRNALPRLFYQE